MADINVSIDAKGNLQCPDITGTLGESVTWVPDPTTVLSIQSITTSVGSFNPVPTARNNWTGTLATDGTLPNGGTGLDYTITVNPKNATGQKQKSPKINVNPPEEKTKREKTLYSTNS